MAVFVYRKQILKLLFVMVFINLILCEDKIIDTEEEKEELLKYKKGSICGYCDYCKFCHLCNNDCPCEKNSNKPNCHMCKYCKFCYLCEAFCDTVCRPGSLLDSVSSSIFGSLPSFSEEEVENDLKSVKEYL